jgi:hypothetical protein
MRAQINARPAEVAAIIAAADSSDKESIVLTTAKVKLICAYGAGSVDWFAILDESYPAVTTEFAHN